MIGGRHSPHAGGKQKSCVGRERHFSPGERLLARHVPYPHSPIHPRPKKKQDAVVPGGVLAWVSPPEQRGTPFSFSQWDNTNVAPALEVHTARGIV